MKLIGSVLLSLSFACVSACGGSSIKQEEVEAISVGIIKPELDYSNETPDCLTAAQRIEQHVVVGMLLADVRRLVGKPRLITSGKWWWTVGFSKKGFPMVEYRFGESNDDEPITSFSSDSSKC